MFYLLKSSYNREKVGDMLIDLNEVQAVAVGCTITSDVNVYGIICYMKNTEHYVAKCISLDEVKRIIKEILGDKISDADLADIVPQEK